MYNWKLPHVNSTLNGCIVFNWNADVLCFSKMKTWGVQYDFEMYFFQSKTLRFVKLFNQNLTRFEFFFQNLTR